MRIENAQRNQNFGAIKLSGFDFQKDDKTIKEIKTSVKKFRQNLLFGQEENNEFTRYILTKQGLKQESRVLEVLKNLLKKNKNIKVEACSDEAAWESIRRF
ncbi:MAG: hypothetical protein WCF95_06670 [bacterium]